MEIKNQSMQKKRQKMIKRMIGKFIGSKCRYEKNLTKTIQISIFMGQFGFDVEF